MSRFVQDGNTGIVFEAERGPDAESYERMLREMLASESVMDADTRPLLELISIVQRDLRLMALWVRKTQGHPDPPEDLDLRG